MPPTHMVSVWKVCASAGRTNRLSDFLGLLPFFLVALPLRLATALASRSLYASLSLSSVTTRVLTQALLQRVVKVVADVRLHMASVSVQKEHVGVHRLRRRRIAKQSRHSFPLVPRRELAILPPTSLYFIGTCGIAEQRGDGFRRVRGRGLAAAAVIVVLGGDRELHCL